MLPFHGNRRQVRENFARQFMPDGEFYVYRRGQRGAGYRLTAAEREAFVVDFNSGLGRIYWSALVAVIAALILFTWRADLLPRVLRPWSPTIGLGMTTIAFVAIWWRLWTAPERALDRRVAIKPPLDGDARWRVNFGRLAWTPIVMGALVCLLLAAMGATEWRLARSGLDYAVGGMIGLAFFVVMAVIKRRLR